MNFEYLLWKKFILNLSSSHYKAKLLHTSVILLAWYHLRVFLDQVSQQSQCENEVKIKLLTQLKPTWQLLWKGKKILLQTFNKFLHVIYEPIGVLIKITFAWAKPDKFYPNPPGSYHLKH